MKKLALWQIIAVMVGLLFGAFLLFSCKYSECEYGYNDCIEICKTTSTVDDKITCMKFCDERKQTCKSGG